MGKESGDQARINELNKNLADAVKHLLGVKLSIVRARTCAVTNEVKGGLNAISFGAQAALEYVEGLLHGTR